MIQTRFYVRVKLKDGEELIWSYPTRLERACILITMSARPDVVGIDQWESDL